MEKLTKDDILGIRVGEIRIYSLPSYKACRNAQCYVYILQKLHGGKFSTSIKDNKITITRKEL